MKILSRICELENIALAAALVIGLTACSGSDETIIDEPTPPTADAPKTYTMTVTASKGDDALTRALTIEGKTLNATWTAGDAVQVYHVNNPGTAFETESTTPDATLYAQSSGASTKLTGTFTGSYTPTSGDVLRLRFLPNPDYTNQKGTLDYIATNCDYAVSEITVASVDAETGDVTSSAPAEFANQQAVVKFSLKRQDGTTPVAATSLTVKVGSTTYNVTLASASSDIYVAIKNASNKTVSLSANSALGHYTYEKSGVTFVKSKYYAIGVKMTKQPSLGDLYYSDGTCSERLEAGKTPIGVIAYLGTDAFTETGTTVGGSTFTGHGLVMCLKNAASGSDAKWSTEEMLVFPLGQQVMGVDDLKRTTNVSGYTNTATLTADDETAEKYPAAKAAKNYTALPAPATGTTGWFLPSAQQWVKMQTGLGGLNESVIAWSSVYDTSCTAVDKWEDALWKAGDGNYDSMMGDSELVYYMTSSESSYDGNVVLYFSQRQDHKGFYWYFLNKTDGVNANRVRPVLAF